MIFCGLVGGLVAGILLDYTKRYDEIAKIALALSTLSMVWFLQVFNREDQAANIAVCLCVFGFFAFVLVPACLELGVEITYPVTESISSGLLWSAALVLAPAVGGCGRYIRNCSNVCMYVWWALSRVTVHVVGGRLAM